MLISSNAEIRTIRELSVNEIKQVNGGKVLKKALEIAIDIITLVAIAFPKCPHQFEELKH